MRIDGLLSESHKSAIVSSSLFFLIGLSGSDESDMGLCMCTFACCPAANLSF